MSSYYYSEAIKTEGAKEKIKELKKKKDLLKILLIFIICIAAIYVLVTGVYTVLSACMSFITLFGVMYIDAGGDPTGYNNLLSTTGFLLKNGVYVVGIAAILISIIYSVRLIYIYSKIGDMTTKNQNNLSDKE